MVDEIPPVLLMPGEEVKMAHGPERLKAVAVDF